MVKKEAKIPGYDKMVKIYKIRRKSDGLFSSGGCAPSFDEHGKSWKKLNHVRCHITLTKEYKENNGVYDDCEITCGIYEFSGFGSIQLSDEKE